MSSPSGIGSPFCCKNESNSDFTDASGSLSSILISARISVEFRRENWKVFSLAGAAFFAGTTFAGTTFAGTTFAAIVFADSGCGGGAAGGMGVACLVGADVGPVVGIDAAMLVDVAAGLVCAVGVDFFGLAVVTTGVEDDSDEVDLEGAASGFEVTFVV